MRSICRYLRVMEAAEFYTGIVPEIYTALRTTRFDSAHYRRFVEEHGWPALELGCGDDGPFFELAAAGLALVGIDSSPDMVRRGRARLERDGITTARIEQQRMEKLDLGTTFASIYLAGPTFNLLPDDATARRALRAIARHLRPDGAALIPLWRPRPTPPELIGSTRTAPTASAQARYTVLGEDYDPERRTRATRVRYELIADGSTRAADREWVIHWYTDEMFRELSADAGLQVRLTPVDDEQVEATLRPA